MDHADHVQLIRDGVQESGPRWLELGAGRGAFTLALGDLLGPTGEIVAVDHDVTALASLVQAMAERFPATGVSTVAADFAGSLELGTRPFDGILAANALHFRRDPAMVLARLRRRLRPGGRVVVVEYDADTGNPWVPHPISFRRLPEVLEAAGFGAPRLIGRVPSRFLGSIYAAVSEPAG